MKTIACPTCSHAGAVLAVHGESSSQFACLYCQSVFECDHAAVTGYRTAARPQSMELPPVGNVPGIVAAMARTNERRRSRVRLVRLMGGEGVAFVPTSV